MPRKKKETPNRKDNLYEVKVTIGKNFDGTLIRKSFYSPISKEDAREKANQYKIEKEVATRTGIGFLDQNVTFTHWAYQWLEIYKKPDIDENTYSNTYLRSVEKHIIPYFKNAKLNNIKPIDIKNFYIQKQNYSQSTLQKLKLCLNSIFETAIDNDLCFKNPAKGVSYISKKSKKEKKVYSDAELKFVKNFFYTQMPEVVLILETGLRCGEMTGLMWEDIDFQQHTLSVNRSIAKKREGGGVKIRPPKWNSYRTIPLSSQAIKLLREIKEISMNHTGYIFSKNNHTPQDPQAWSCKLKKYMNQLPDNIQKLTPHELRHTYGTYLRRKGVDIYTIQKILGHKNIQMTSEIYVHNEMESLKKALTVAL